MTNQYTSQDWPAQGPAPMAEPEAYPHGPKEVVVIQTHISWVYLAGPFVYKVKKPKDMGFLDFSTLEKRRHFCEREVELNQRLAPEVYLGVAALCRGPEGRLYLEESIEPGEEPRDPVVEWAVKMKRLPQEGLFSLMLKRNSLDSMHLEQAARIVADFHKKAQTGEEVNQAGSLETISGNWEEDFAQTRKYLDGILLKEEHEFLRAYVARFLDQNQGLFARRVQGGKIRDCHGDLHLENIIWDNRVVVFDCIEFNERFRHGDTAAEVAFLAMDLEFHQRPDLARVFVETYVQETKDAELAELLNFYKSYRACTRSKVWGFRYDDAADDAAAKAQAADRARRYFDLACQYAAGFRRPTLVLVMGTTGVGKSALAGKIASMAGAEHINSDVVRKRLHGLQPTTKVKVGVAQGLYGPESTEKTYRKMADTAAANLRQGKSVVADATYLLAAERKTMVDAAKRAGARVYVIWCKADEKQLKKRFEERESDPRAVSDGRWDVYLHQKNILESPEETNPDNLLVLSTDRPPAALACRALLFMEAY